MHIPPDREACLTMVAMSLLQPAIVDAMRGQDTAIQARLNNALLNVAVNRIIEAEGHCRAATLLWRLVDVLMAGTSPTPDAPVNLSSVQ